MRHQLLGKALSETRLLPVGIQFTDGCDVLLPNGKEALNVYRTMADPTFETYGPKTDSEYDGDGCFSASGRADRKSMSCCSVRLKAFNKRLHAVIA